MADLLVNALFFCLCSCDYTKTNLHCRTTQFRFQDMQFHDANGVIPRDAVANVFLEASAVTLFLDTQNNCVSGKSSTMETTGLLNGELAPACSRLYLHLQKSNPPTDTPICTYYVSMGAAPKYVMGTNIVELLGATAQYIGFQRIEFSPY